MPLAIAPIACSRTPKCMFRPPCVSASRSPAPSKVSLVLVDGARSAAPPTRADMLCAIAFSTLPPASRDAIPVASGSEVRNVAGPAVGQPAFEQTIELLGELGMLGAIADQGLLPGLAKRPRPIGEAGAEMIHDSGRHEELRILGPAVIALRLPDRFRAHRIAMRLGGAGDRRAPADDAVDDDQGRRVARSAERLERLRDSIEIVRVGDVQDVPAIAAKPLGHAFAERERRSALDRDVVIVVDPAKVRQA